MCCISICNIQIPPSSLLVYILVNMYRIHLTVYIDRHHNNFISTLLLLYNLSYYPIYATYVVIYVRVGAGRFLSLRVIHGHLPVQPEQAQRRR